MAKLKVDFISDVSCPWCVIGLRALEDAIARVDDVDVDVTFKPFELNPEMAAGGQDFVEHIGQKYGSTPQQSMETKQMIRERGAELGFVFDVEKWDRIYNTFDTHRLLHWAAVEGKQRELKHALFSAYFTEGKNPGDHGVLLEVAAAVGLDTAQAKEILESDQYAEDVRSDEAQTHAHGIHAVPAVVVNDKHLIQGGQPVEVFEQALRQIAAESDSAQSA